MTSDFASKPARDHAIKLAITAATLFSLCSGCGATQGSGTLPQLLPVKGKVVFKGQPLTTGTVRFEPDDYGRAASGKLQSDGTFVLTTLKEGDGVVPGHHRVSITNPDIKSKDGAALVKYLKTSKSKLEADVSPEKTEFTFELN
jgi:hypothetical protein